DVGSEAKVVRTLVPANITGIHTRRIAVAMGLKVVGRAEVGEPVDQDARPAKLRAARGFEARHLHDGPAEVLISAGRHIVEILPEVAVIGVDDESRARHIGRRNTPLEKVPLYEAGAGVGPADGKTAKRSEDSLSVGVMVEHTEAEKRVQLGGRVPVEL